MTDTLSEMMRHVLHIGIHHDRSTRWSNIFLTADVIQKIFSMLRNALPHFTLQIYIKSMNIL